jgi:hypothetical protein
MNGSHAGSHVKCLFTYKYSGHKEHGFHDPTLLCRGEPLSGREDLPGTSHQDDEIGNSESACMKEKDTLSSHSMEKRARAPVFDLIDRQEWDALKDLIRSDPGVARSGMAMGGSDRRSSEHQLPLHEACKQQPPLDVVELLIDAYPSALKVKGHGGYTPLHCAVSYGSSADVIAKLIQSYPPGTRMRDDVHQVLPIHLAAKWGAAEDVVMEILVAHPEGYYIRDGSGLTPLDYANQIRLASEREHMRNILSQAPLLCKVSKAAQIRVSHEHETKMRSMEDAHAAQVLQWEEKYVQEKLKSRNRHQSLKQELKTVTELADTTSRQLDEKVRVLTELTTKCSDLEVRLEKERKQFKNTLDVQNAQMQSAIEAEANKSKELLQRVTAKEAQIGELEEKIENLEGLKTSLEVELNSEREVVGMMVEEVEKLAEAEALLQCRVEVIKELESKVEMGELAREILSQKLEEIEKARMEVEDKLMQSQAECDVIQAQNTDLVSKLNNSNRLVKLYNTRIEQLHRWFKEVTHDMDSWRTSDRALFELLESQQQKSSSDSNCDNATLETEEETYDSSHQTVEDREQTAYAGVEVSLEPIANELHIQTGEGISPTSGHYRTRISPSCDYMDNTRQNPEGDTSVIDFDEYGQHRGNDAGRRERVDLEEPTRADSMGAVNVRTDFKEELVHYFTATTRVIQQEKPQPEYLVTTVEEKSDSTS